VIKNSSISVILSLSFVITLGFSVNSTAQTPFIPAWIKNNAKWWSEGQIGDDDFVKGIQFLISQKTLVIPYGEVNSVAAAGHQIPSWIKNDAGWWANGLVSDDEFVKGIQYLMNEGIIQIQYSRPVSCNIINETLPDPKCTPGAADPAVTQSNIDSTICVSGYASSVRPPVSVTEPIKVQMMQDYGLSDSPSNYELDHLIPLELGGAPDDIKNLWPEPYYTLPNATDKDGFENYLHNQVCSGNLDLKTAQDEIATNWINYWIDAGMP
jgi:hypothetical protein